MAYGRALTPQEAKSGQYAKNQVVRSGNGLYLKDNNQQPTQSYTDFINQAFNNKDYLKAQQEASDLASQAPDFLAKKQAELQASDPALQQLNQERAKFTGDLYSAPFTARDQLSGILDPVKREALVSQAVGNVMGQLQGTQGMISQRQGTQNDLAQRAYDIFKSQLDQKQGTVDSMGKTLKDIAEKGYAEKVKATDRIQSLKDKQEMYLFEQRNKRFAPSNTNTFKDRPLTFTEAKTLGVPIGTKLSQVQGKQVPNLQYAQKDKAKFLSEYQQRNSVSLEPTNSKSSTLYNDYIDAVDAIRSSSDPLTTYNTIIAGAPDLKGVLDAPKPMSSAELLNQAILQSVGQ